MSCCSASGTCTSAAEEGGHSVEARIAGERLLAGARELGGGLRQSDFTVPGMHCIGCIKSIERGLSALPGVERARANLSLKRVSVVWREGEGSPLAASEALEKLGFEHTPFDLDAPQSDAEDRVGKRLLQALAVAGFAAANIMLLSVSVWSGAEAETAQLFHLISGLIALPAVAFSGRPFFESAWSALRVGRLNMDVPISLAVLLAFAMSTIESLTGGEEAYFDAAVTLLFFLLIGRYLDHLMRRKARGAVERLGSLGAKGAVHVAGDGTLDYLPLKEVEPGMRLRVAPGERLPVDGVVLSGATDVDRSLVTGESAPVPVRPGDRLEAGTLALAGALDIEAERRAEDSFLAEVARMMEAAEQGRSRYVRVADRMARIYAPAVHLIALVTFIGWVIATGDWHASIYTAIAVLIVTCPCALGLAVPVVHVIAAGRLFDAGIMVRDGAAFERLAEIDRVVFDKTGTLTTGTPSVSAMDGTLDAPGLAAAMAARSAHPMARAIARHLAPSGQEARIESMEEVSGAGVEGRADGRHARLGRPDWVAEIAAGPAPSGSGVAFAVEGEPAALFRLRETLRADALEAVATLKARRLDMELLSGDAPGPVASVAAALGIDRYRAGATPHAKIARLEQLRERHSKVLMVGDGLNDAPALAAGHVSMAPATGSDVSRLAADMVFTSDSLSAVPFAHRIALRTGALVRQNFGLAILYNCIAVPLAVAGYVTPLIAALAMSGSSIAVVSNSLRLMLERRERMPHAPEPPRPATGAAEAVTP